MESVLTLENLRLLVAFIPAVMFGGLWLARVRHSGRLSDEVALWRVRAEDAQEQLRSTRLALNQAHLEAAFAKGEVAKFDHDGDGKAGGSKARHGI